MKQSGRLTILLSFAAALAACAGAGAPASSASSQPSGGGGWMDACSSDAAKLCPNAQGRRQIRQCLMQNQSSLSSGCQQALASAHHGRGGGGQGGGQ